MCMIADCESPEFYRSETRRGRKPHRCDECYREIDAGETYQYVCAKWDGTVQVICTCRHCMVVQAVLQERCHGFVHLAIREDIEEHIFGNLPWKRDARRLTAGMLRKWRGLSGQLLPLPKVVVPVEWDA